MKVLTRLKQGLCMSDKSDYAYYFNIPFLMVIKASMYAPEQIFM